MPFSNSGSCTRITYLNILQTKRNIKSPRIFFGQLKRCADNRMRLKLAGCEKFNISVNITKFEGYVFIL